MCGGGGGGGMSDAEEQAQRERRVAAARQQALIDAQVGEANEFRSRIPTLESQYNDTVTQTARQGLAQELVENKKNFARRGLLNSGAQKNRDMMLRAEAGGNLAQARSGIRSGLQEQARGMEGAALAGQLGQYRGRQQAENEIFNNALGRVQQRQQMYGDLARAGGQAAGYAIGRG